MNILLTIASVDAAIMSLEFGLHFFFHMYYHDDTYIMLQDLFHIRKLHIKLVLPSPLLVLLR